MESSIEVDLVEHLSDLLARGDTKSMKTLLDEDSFGCLLEEKACDVIPLASYYLNKETMQEKPATVKYSVKVIMKCAEKGNPKECLMELLAQIESLDEVKFQMLLKPIQITMLRIPNRKAPLMLCVINAIYSFINSLKVPKYHFLDRNSKLLMDCDESFVKIRANYQLILSFYETFVNEISTESSLETRVKNIKLALIQALLRLLGGPAAFLDLEEHEKGSSVMRVLSSKIVKMLLKIQVDPINLLTLVEDKALLSVEEEKLVIKEFSSNEIKFSELSLSVFFYLIFCENMCSSCPQVYNKLYIFENTLALAVILLRYKETLVLRKGLLLCKEAIEKTECGSVLFSNLTSNTHKEIITLLSNIAVYHDAEENRKLSAQLIKNHFLAFEPKAQFYILCKIGSSEQHPFVIGFFTTFFTDVVKETFSNPAMREYFTGKRLSDLLKVFCSLKKGAKSDLIENKNQIISSLNLIIFLTRRDRKNVTGIWNYVSQLKETFMCPLREGIMLSRAHYELQLKTLNDPLNAEEDTEFNVSVGGEMLGQMTVDEKINVISSSLTVFDLIDHLLSRADECVMDKPTIA